MPRKGEMNAAAIDRGWPHQAAIPNAQMSKQFREIQDFCATLSRCPRGYSYYTDQSYDVVCFAKAEDARLFAERFGATLMDPTTRPRHPARRRRGR